MITHGKKNCTIFYQLIRFFCNIKFRNSRTEPNYEKAQKLYY